MPVLGTADECPLLYVVGARSAKEAISIANHCGAGAAVSMWTESSAFAMEASLQLKVLKYKLSKILKFCRISCSISNTFHRLAQSGSTAMVA